ncbi:LysR family transcriptional regulator [Humitalea sp. 24SJ18S-53]|uniref:LysR family transcriptional regulator n=1 Tax=Humitalea sp. 24SJ18S-53 TaxID=3422307 RepID=UPI003D679478
MLDGLTLDQLRIFVAVADTGSFSAAGVAVQRVQSAVSQSVRALETTLGLQLFDRTLKKPRLTDAGRTVLADARRVIGDAETLRGRASSIANGLEPELTLSLSQLLERQTSMDVMRELSQTFPNLPVRLLTGGIAAPERYLRAGTVELAIFPLGLTDATDLETEFLVDVPLVPVVAASHPLAALPGPLSRDALSTHVQLVLTDTLTPEDWSLGVVSHLVWRFADMNTRLAFLLNGFGWCNMPLHLVAPHIASGVLKRLVLKQRNGFVMQLHAVHHPARPPGRAGRWLIERLRERLAVAEPQTTGLADNAAPAP